MAVNEATQTQENKTVCNFKTFQQQTMSSITAVASYYSYDNDIRSWLTDKWIIDEEHSVSHMAARGTAYVR